MTYAWKVHKERLDDIAAAIKAGDGFSALAALWKTSRPGAWMWCNRYSDEASMDALARNGETMRATSRDVPTDESSNALGDRLAIIADLKAQGWSVARIARAMGMRPASLHLWIIANAPDGVSEALSDFAEEAA